MLFPALITLAEESERESESERQDDWWESPTTPLKTKIDQQKVRSESIGRSGCSLALNVFLYYKYCHEPIPQKPNYFRGNAVSQRRGSSFCPHQLFTVWRCRELCPKTCSRLWPWDTFRSVVNGRTCPWLARPRCREEGAGGESVCRRIRSNKNAKQPELCKKTPLRQKLMVCLSVLWMKK